MLPVLYSLQHCPYAMRARLGLLMAQQQVILRAIKLNNKPEEMIKISQKGTVPVLSLPDSTVIDESLDIMIWALQENDPEDLLHKNEPENLTKMINLIHHNDKVFKPQLELYKKAKRFHLDTVLEERKKCEIFIADLEQRLLSGCFIGQKISLVEYALLPFVRQFSRVNRSWFNQAPYPKLRAWLDIHQQSKVYAKSMIKYPLWLEEHTECILGEH